MILETKVSLQSISSSLTTTSLTTLSHHSPSLSRFAVASLSHSSQSLSLSIHLSIYISISPSSSPPFSWWMYVCPLRSTNIPILMHIWSYHRVIATAPGKRVFPYNITLHSPRTSVSSLNVPIVADTKTFHVCMGSNPLQELRCLCSRKRREEWYLVQFKLLSPEIWNCS